MADPTTDLPDHPWSDPDDDGHNCEFCDSASIWKCDEKAHDGWEDRGDDPPLGPIEDDPIYQMIQSHPGRGPGSSGGDAQ